MYRNFGIFSILASLCFAGGALAQTVSMELIAPPNGPSMAGVYTSPYTALIGAAGQTTATISGTPTLVICDDFLTDVSTATPPWQATATNMSALAGESTASSAVKFDRTASAAKQITDYMTVAYLAEELMAIDQSTTAGQTTAGELSFAIWNVFDSFSPLPTDYLNSAQRTQALNYLSLAQTAVAGKSPTDFSNVTIYTPTPSGASQEYLTVTTPEASTIALLAVDISGLAGLVFLLRRRFARAGAKS